MLFGIIKWCTHLHSPPASLIHPNYFPVHSHQSPPPIQKCPTPTPHPYKKKMVHHPRFTHLTKTLYTISYMTIWPCCHIRSQTFTKPTANTPDRMMTYSFTHPPIHITIWLNGHRSSCYKLEMLYLPYNKVYGNQN